MIIYNLFLNILFLPLILVYIIFAIFNRRASKTFIQRLGFSNIKKYDKPVWFHCSSVGEVNAVKNLVKEIKKVYPNVFITTLTDTGLNKAREIVGYDRSCIIPFDFNFIIKNFIKKLNPKLLIIEETEIWPNMILQSYHKGVPIIYINALISEKSFKFYKAFKFIFSKILNKIERFFVQNSETENYLQQLGISSDKISYIGVTKFDIPLFINKKYKKVFDSKSSIICGGSIRDGEDEILIKVFKKLKNDYNNLKLILAPRHIDKVNRISKLLHHYSLDFEIYSQIKEKAKKDILVIDKMGVLIQMYKNSSITFIGGTLVPIGGHNPLEPAACGKPIISGPYIKNNYVAFKMLKDNNALITINNEEELYQNLQLLLKNPKMIKEMGNKAVETLKNNQGVSKKLKNFIWKNYLKK